MRYMKKKGGKTMETDTVQQLFRKRGFSDTLETLKQFPDHEAPQSEFFTKLGDRNSYPNTYFRVKADLLKYKIIAFKLNENNEKVIYLTKKGEEILEKIEQIEQLLINKKK